MGSPATSDVDRGLRRRAPAATGAACLVLAVAGSLRPTPVHAAEPIVLVCRGEFGVGGAEERGDGRLYAVLDFDRKTVKLLGDKGLGAPYPEMSIILVNSWLVQFADREESPLYFGSVNRVTGELRLESVAAPPPAMPATAVSGRCERTSRLF